MIRGTTPTHRFVLDSDVDMSTIADVRVSYGQHNQEIFCKTLEDITIDDHTIITTLTQEESLSFNAMYEVQIQLRILLTDGRVRSTNTIIKSVGDTLNEEVL